MNVTPYGPSYWTTLDKPVDHALCERVLAHLRTKLHGKMRQAHRIKINSKVKLREDMVALGKQSKYIHEMLGESDPVTNLDVLHTPTGPLFERKAIYEKLTHDFGKAYAGTQEHRTGIHKKEWDWTTGGTKANFLKRIKHHKIPPHFTNLIWEHMTNVPKAKLVHTDLQQLLDTPPSFDEFGEQSLLSPANPLVDSLRQPTQ